MGISHDIISEFVKITNDKKEKPKEETVYATIVQASDGKYVKIDGSDLVTPTETTTDIEEGERVTVLIKDHSAIITGNVTSPSASVNRVNGIVDVVSEKLGVFETIVADKIDVNELNAYKATIENLIVGKAEIEDLKATKAEIEFLDADVAHIKTLVNGNLTSDNILSFNITADKVTMADAFIKDAMVDTINAAKINAGRINTNNVVIGSDDGGMLISGATQQFTDKDGKVRIQIGRDSTGDFTFVLYGEDGTGQIINQNGITASAVSDGLIVNNMINNNAAISGGKLDISSVIFEINNENDTAIHSSKIYLDEQNQSLEAAFNSLKTQVDTIVDISIDGDLKAFTEQIQSNTAKIEMNKSSIKTLVSEDAIIRKEVSDLEGNLVEATNTLSSKYASLEQSMDGFKLEAADVYATKSTVKDLENNLTTNYTTTEAMNSAITQSATEIATTVARDEIQNTKIGGTNLIGQTSETGGYGTEIVEVTETGWTVRGSVDDRDNAVFRFYNVLDGNGWYTFSFDGKFGSSGFRTYVEANDQRVGEVYLTSEWQHFSFTFEVTNYDFDNTGTYTFIEFQRLGNELYYFKNVKLEHGKIETDYSPCPRDYSTTTKMNSAIQQKADEINLTVNKIKRGARIARWVRCYMQGNTVNSGNHIVQVQVWSNGTNLALGKIPYSNGVLDNPGRMTDGNLDTYSYAELYPNGDVYWEIDLGDEYPIDDITLWNYYGDSRRYNYVLVTYDHNWEQLGVYNTWVGGTYVETSSGKNFVLNSSTVNNNLAQIDIKADSIKLKVDAVESDLKNNYPTRTQMNSAITQKANEITSAVNMTKIGGVELLPQGYKGGSTSGYSVITGGVLKCDEWGLYTTQQAFIISDYIAVDPNLPIAYEYEITNADGTPRTYLGVEQFTGTLAEVGENAAIIYFLQTSFRGTKKDYGTLTLNSNTRYIRLRWLSDWNSEGMSYCQLNSISLKQLGSINQSTKISQMSDSISSTVSSVNSLGSRMSTAESTITQHTNQIATKVDVNGVKSTIQQNPESVRIGFNGISNYFDLTSARLKVGHTDGSYTEIGQNGIMYYANGSGNRYHCLIKQGWLGQISGTTWSRTITLPSEFKGKTFSVIVSVTEVNAVDTHDVIKHFKVTVPHNTVNYTNGTFVINMSALAYYVPGQQSATAIQTDVSWIAIC